GAGPHAREPGIHIHRWWLWIPGPAFGRPGMTGTHKKRARLTRVPQPAPGLDPAPASLDEKCGRGKGCSRAPHRNHRAPDFGRVAAAFGPMQRGAHRGLTVA